MRFASIALACLAAGACSKSASKRDAGPDGAADAPPTDVGRPDADAPDDSRADVPDAGTADASGDRAMFTSWTSCGWVSGPNVCLCDGLATCAAVAGGVAFGLGSDQVRACAVDGDTCEYVAFHEIEGGGVAWRCRVSIDAGVCDGDHPRVGGEGCVELFRCNLLMGNCPSDLMPPSFISCR